MRAILAAPFRALSQRRRTKTPSTRNNGRPSGYKPTPTIIEAAQALYQGHRVEEITRSDAGAKNLSETTTCIEKIIEEANAKRHKAICLVTGVPGAGKTLAGLNLVTHRTKAHEEEHAVFLSGNGPLVDVLREALARDEQAQAKEHGQTIAKAEAARKVKSFIQNIHHFRDAICKTRRPRSSALPCSMRHNAPGTKTRPLTSWPSARASRNFDQSEPEFLISVMDRHPDWCTIVCLIGGGQEINAGEAGLTEWFAALKKRFGHWKIYTSPQLTHRDYHWDQDLPALLAASGTNLCPICTLPFRSGLFAPRNCQNLSARLSPAKSMPRDRSMRRLKTPIRSCSRVTLTKPRFGCALGPAARSASA